MLTAVKWISFSFNKKTFKAPYFSSNIVNSSNIVITLRLALALGIRQDCIVLDMIQIQSTC